MSLLFKVLVVVVLVAIVVLVILVLLVVEVVLVLPIQSSYSVLTDLGQWNFSQALMVLPFALHSMPYFFSSTADLTGWIPKENYNVK